MEDFSSASVKRGSQETDLIVQMWTNVPALFYVTAMLLATCVNAPSTYSCFYPLQGARSAEEHAPHSGSLHSSDPCSNSRALNNPWRSTSYRGGAFCDRDKKGWYRFIGRGGTRMPVACVPKHHCSTEAPMWLNGSHPTTDVGIVNRIACAHWNGNCCFWSTSVQVKACAGGYYVYKFDGLPTCSLIYCTDPGYTESPCPQCGEGDECRLVNGKWVAIAARNSVVLIWDHSLPVGLCLLHTVYKDVGRWFWDLYCPDSFPLDFSNEMKRQDTYEEFGETRKTGYTKFVVG